uniref:Zinc finger, CCHC-type n=1 Tax=Tanacetum cinerariifolium TaxID=118510 RepID=A0A6L2L1U7_TANCI|nr:zinc finger, CCHC-type [Tanacetum cinerariifolium]
MGNVLDSCNQRSTQQCMKSGVAKHLGVTGIQQQNGLVDETNMTFKVMKLWRLDDVTSKVVLYKNMGFNECAEYKKTFIGFSVGTGSMQVLHGFEFEVEPLGDHTFKVQPQENIDQGSSLQEVQTQDLIDYQLARDREQHLECELFRYREDSNEAVFAVAVVDKIYAYESLTFNDTVACEVISKWKDRLKEDMDVQSNVYVLNNGCRKCSDDNDGYYEEYTPGMFIHLFLYIDDMVFSYGCKAEIWATKGLLDKAKGNVFVEVHSIPSLEGSLSGDYDVEKNGYGLMILGCAGSLKANLQHMEALSTTEVGYMTFTEACKKKIWLKGLFTELRYELSLVAGIATGALVKGDSRSEVPAQVEIEYAEVLRRVRGGNTLTILSPSEEEQVELKDCSLKTSFVLIGVLENEVPKKQNEFYTQNEFTGAVVRLPDPKQKTLGKKGIDCIFVGYAKHSKTYRFYIIEPNDYVSINSIIESRDAIFDENHFSSIPRPKDIILNMQESQMDNRTDDVPSEILEPRKEKDPRTYNEAMQSRDAAFWKEAIDDEIGSIMENSTWVLSDLLPGCKPLVWIPIK